MKNILILFAMFISLNSFSNATPDVYTEINRKVFIDFTGVDLGEDHKEVVYVEFHILNDEIIIDDVLSENNLVEEKLIERLNRIRINSSYEEGEVYRIKVSFIDEYID